jgi:hypothetical protein
MQVAFDKATAKMVDNSVVYSVPYTCESGLSDISLQKQLVGVLWKKYKIPTRIDGGKIYSCWATVTLHKNSQTDGIVDYMVEEIVEDNTFGYTTVEQYEKSLQISMYSDLFKDMNGIRPRWINWDEISLQEAQEMVAQLINSRGE